MGHTVDRLVLAIHYMAIEVEQAAQLLIDNLPKVSDVRVDLADHI